MIVHRLIIENFGPINNCEIEVDDFSVFTGPQASGKSTIAKTIFFFRTIKNDLYEIIVRRIYHPEIDAEKTVDSFYNLINKKLRSKFIQLFGSSKEMSKNMHLKYSFNDNTSVEVSLNERSNRVAEYNYHNFIWLRFSPNIREFIDSRNSGFDVDSLKSELSVLFCDKYETIFVPAGRSMITTLTTQLNYFFAVMDNDQRSSLDYCTQKYIELIFKIRPLLSEGVEGYWQTKQFTEPNSDNLSFIKRFIKFGNMILKGKYIYADNEERLIIDNGDSVKINYISSGQQEYVWILNILAYQIINKVKTFLIIEEPEAHLYPDAQKGITELLSMFHSFGNGTLITTHSPYVLGSLNNMLFANQIIEEKPDTSEKVYAVIDKDKVLEKCQAYNIKNGDLSTCMAEDGLIANEVIDGASSDINEAYDSLFSISEGMEE